MEKAPFPNKSSKNYSDFRMTNTLSLRKKKLNQVLSKRRNIKDQGLIDYQIKLEELKIDDKLKNKVYQMEDFIKEMKTHIKSTELEYQKYALMCLRKQTLEKSTMDNKKDFVEKILKEDFISDILNIMANNLNNKQILYEGLWVLINFTYYETDSVEAFYYLSNELCINLYIKICQSNDINLRGSVFWLVCNLIENNPLYERSRKIMLNFYMTPLIREYILFDIENRKDLSDNYEDIILHILSRLTDVVNEINTALNLKDIKVYSEINKNITYENLRENNDYLFSHIFNLFIRKVTIKDYSDVSLYALAKLSNYLEDKTIMNNFMISGIFRKIITDKIQYNEDNISHIIQIVGNYLTFVEDSLLDKIIIDETFKFFFKLFQKHSNNQLLKRDIFWAMSNLTAGTNYAVEVFCSSGMLNCALQILNAESDYNEFVITEVLYNLLSFFDLQNVQEIIKHFNLNYMKSFCLCLKSWEKFNSEKREITEEGIMDKLINAIGALIEIGEFLRQQTERNVFLEEFEKNNGFELLENILSGHDFAKNLTEQIENLLSMQNKK